MTSASTSNADKFSEVPTRVVVHVDLDCFYCAPSMRRASLHVARHSVLQPANIPVYAMKSRMMRSMSR